MFFPLNSPQGDGNGAQNFPIQPAYREYLSQNRKDEIAHPFAADLQTPPMTTTQPTIAQSPTPPQTLPAGGDDPDRFDVREAWYPLHYVDDLDKTRPTRFTLLGQDVAIWWEPLTQTWRVFADRCPHRLAPLSEGRVNEAGQLECPYHGWAFSGTGECEVIPQQPRDSRAHRSPRACATALPTAVRQGLLFVYPGRPERAERVDPPLVEPLEEDPEGWVVLNTFRDLPYDALTLLENVLDASHIPYTHHKTVSKRDTAAPMTVAVPEFGKGGFSGIWEEGPRKGQLGTQHTTFTAPGLMYHDLTSRQFGRTLTVVYATPTRKGECRLFARFPFKFNAKLPGLFVKLTPRWYGHIGNNGVLEDDQIFLHLQERHLERSGDKPYAQACYLPTQADRYVSAYRRWVDEFDADPFPGETLPPARSQSELLDRYHSHVVHCRSCRTALARIQAIRRTALGLGAIAVAALPMTMAWVNPPTPSLGLAFAGLPLLALAVWWGSGNLERKFYEGNPIPPRNRA